MYIIHNIPAARFVSRRECLYGESGRGGGGDVCYPGKFYKLHVNCDIMHLDNVSGVYQILYFQYDPLYQPPCFTQPLYIFICCFSASYI